MAVPPLEVLLSLVWRTFAGNSVYGLLNAAAVSFRLVLPHFQVDCSVFYSGGQHFSLALFVSRIHKGIFVKMLWCKATFLVGMDQRKFHSRGYIVAPGIRATRTHAHAHGTSTTPIRV